MNVELEFWKQHILSHIYTHIIRVLNFFRRSTLPLCLGWKANMLSLVGCSVYIQASSVAIPSYVM